MDDEDEQARGAIIWRDGTTTVSKKIDGASISEELDESDEEVVSWDESSELSD